MKSLPCFFISIFASFALFSCETKVDDVDLGILDMTGKIMIAQWNIGHLNGGGRKNKSNISSDLFEKAEYNYSSLLSSVPASIMSINEYTDIFATDKNGQVYSTANLLFGDYSYNHIGPYNNGPANSLFSKLPLTEVKEVYYKCNETAQISHDKSLKANWYYIVEAKTVINGIKTVVVSTHLAFDLNNEDVARNQVKEIIERYKNEKNVILCGDWNVMDVSIFDYFKMAGYQLANHDVDNN